MTGKRRPIFATLILATLMLFAFVQSALAETSGVYDYTISGGEVTITGYSGPGGSVQIPDTLGGAAVHGIGTSVFQNCTSLTSITIPDSVTHIWDFAFSGCSNLATVTRGDGLKSIGDCAFQDCSSLTTIMLPAGVTSIGGSAFSGCSSLTTVVIPVGVTSIRWKTFYRCSNLTTVTIPPGVSSIGDNAFDKCSNLATVTIPDSVSDIGQGAFEYCYRLERVNIPDGVTTIGGWAFFCTGLRSVTIPASVTSMGERAFCGASSLTSVTISSGVKSIGVGAFESCDYLTSVTIPASVTSIGNQAFYGCLALQSAVFLGDAPTMGFSVFAGARDFTAFYMSGGTGFTTPPGPWLGYRIAYADSNGRPYYTLNYYMPWGWTGGSITGNAAQTVAYGASGTAVTAVPDPGYHFTGWSDGKTSNPRIDTDATINLYIAPIFVPNTVTRIAGGDRYGTAAALARKGWDPTGKLDWTGVEHIVIANGEPGKESDPLSAAGLAGTYDAPVLTVQATKLPGATKTVITEIAKKNPGVKIHIVGGTSVVPDARWNEIKRIPGVSQVKDRFAGRDRFETSALMATRMVAVEGADAINGVILIAGDNPAAFYDALAASPVAYAQTMPMLSVQKNQIPTSVKNVLKTAALKDKPRYAASSATYIGSVPAAGATRMTTTSNRYTAATQIAKFASINRAWTSRADAALASKLPDALTGGAFLGRVGGVMLFTDSTSAIQSTSKAFITGNKASIWNGWVIGGTSVVPTAQESGFRNLLN